MNLKSLEQQIIEKAEKELSAKLDKIFEPVYTSFSYASSEAILVRADNGSRAAVRPYIMYSALKQLAYDIAVEHARQQAVDNFLAEVANLKQQLEDLQNQIPQ